MSKERTSKNDESMADTWPQERHAAYGYGALGVAVQAWLATCKVAQQCMDGHVAAAQAARAGMTTSTAPSGDATMRAAVTFIPFHMTGVIDFQALGKFFNAETVHERATVDRRSVDASVASVLPRVTVTGAWPTTRKNDTGTPNTPPRRQADFAVLLLPNGAMAQPSGRLNAEWQHETAALSYATFARNGQGAIIPARPSLSLLPNMGNLPLPQPTTAPIEQSPVRLEVTVKAGQDFTAEMAQIADQRLAQVLLPALRRTNR